MKRIIIFLITVIATIWVCNAAGAHAGEVFNDDVTVTDAVIPQGEYEGAVIRGNLAISCTVVGQQAFKDAIIVGDVTINARIVSPEAFKDAIIGGKLTVNDDASVDGTAFTSKYDGKIIKGDVALEDVDFIDSEKYKGKVIVGNVSIKRNAVRSYSFSGTIILGNMRLERIVAYQSSFYGIKVTGDLDITRTIGYSKSFDNITVYGEKRIDEKSQFLDLSPYSFSYDFTREDITLENRIINNNEYAEHIFCGDVTLDNSVAQNNAFYNAVILGDIYFKSSVAYQNAFYLAKVIGDFVPDEKSYLEWDAPASESHAGETFEGDVYLTDAVITSGQYKGATFMGNLTVESNLIANQAFENAIILGQLTIKSRTIGTQAFKSAVVSGKATITDATQVIDLLAFSGAQMTDDLDIEAHKLAYNAFAGITVGKKLTIGPDVTFDYIEIEYYNDDYDLYSEDVYDTFKGAKIMGGIDAKCKQLPSRCFKEATISGELTYDSDVTTVGREVFSKAKLNNFTIATQRINASQFVGATITGTLALAEPLQSIGDKAFNEARIENCPTLPATLTSIGDKAFWGCSMTGTLALPEGVTIGNQAFASNRLTTISLPDDVTFTELTNGNRGVFAYNSIEEITIPATWESIPDRIFEGCSYLKTISFSDDASLRKIGVSSFKSCGIKTISLPKRVTEIGDSAFNLVQATTIILPLNIEKVGKYAFESIYQKEGGQLPTLCRNVFIPEKKGARLDLSGTGICSIDTLHIWASAGNDLALPTIKNDYGYYATWWLLVIDQDRQGTYSYYQELDDPWFMRDGSYKTYFDKGVVYVPYGLKKFLQSQVPAADNEWEEALCLLPDDHWIEIEMYEYPYCQRNPYPAGIEQVGSEASDGIEVARYDINGRLLSTPQPGINIIRYSDGTVKKVVVR